MGLLGDLGKGDPTWCGMRYAKKKKAKKKAKKKTTLQRKTRAYVEWLHGGGRDPSHHAFPVPHDFVSLCGERFGGLSGGHSRPKKCSTCRDLAKTHVAAVKEKEKAAWKRWLKNKKRQELMGQIAKGLETLDQRDLNCVAGYLNVMYDEGILWNRHLSLPGLENR